MQRKPGISGGIACLPKFLGGRVSPWNFKESDESITTLDTEAAIMTLSSPEALVQAAVAGAGIAQVGVHHARKHLLAGELKVVLLAAHHPGSSEMTLQYPHRAPVAPRVRPRSITCWTPSGSLPSCTCRCQR